VAAALLLPLVYLLIRASGAGGQAWDLLARPRTATLLINTVALSVVVTIAAACLALPLAWLLSRSDLPARRGWEVLCALPLAVPTYILGFTYVAAFGPRGMLQQALQAPFGVQRLPEIYGFAGAAIVLTLSTFPLVLLSVRAALDAVDPDLEAAAQSFGADRWQVLRRVTLPLVRPAIVSGGLLAALYVLSDFGAVSLLHFDTLSWGIYLQYGASFDRSLAAVLGLLLVLLAGSVLLLERLTRGQARYHRVAPGAAQARPMTRLGVWRWPALAFCSAVVLLGLGVPLAVIVSWMVYGGAASAPSVMLQSLWNAASASGLATIAATLAALPVAILAARYRGAASGAVEAATYLGYALPAIVVALSLVFFGANFARPLYQTLGLLVFAYAIRFLPEAIGAQRASLLQVAPALEEAARVSGLGPVRAFRDTTLRLAAPGVLAGAALVFLTALKELPMTLLLGPIGFKTLATTVWSSASEARYAEAATPALMLVAVASVATAILITRSSTSPSPRDLR
jgi:iron(III) transport system permease protein